MPFRNIEIDESIIIKNKIPLLVYDKEWKKLFGNIDNKDIINTKEKLIEAINKKNQLEREEAKLKKDKNFAMKMILGISNSINNENKVENVNLLDKYKDKIESINERLDELSFELENIYKEIRDLNFNLLKATVYYGYRDIKKKEKKLKKIVEELEFIRERARLLINEKYDYEEWINSAYSFLHGILGRDEIEKLDEEILE
ncbi:MAG: hypothetical protein GX069_10790 [Tissierellia bacterium]|nr:hypothetical protein [Tissierellia bacterium]